MTAQRTSAAVALVAAARLWGMVLQLAATAVALVTVVAAGLRERRTA